MKASERIRDRRKAEQVQSRLDEVQARLDAALRSQSRTDEALRAQARRAVQDAEHPLNKRIEHLEKANRAKVIRLRGERTAARILAAEVERLRAKLEEARAQLQPAPEDTTDAALELHGKLLRLLPQADRRLADELAMPITQALWPWISRRHSRVSRDRRQRQTDEERNAA